MNKQIIIENAKKYFKNELLNIVINQIEKFFEVYNSDYQVNHDYKIGDNVNLSPNHLLHGIGTHSDVLEIISKRGIVSQDYFDECSNHAFCYESAFWTVNKEISLQDYVKNYSGMVVKYNDQYVQVPYGNLDAFVEKMRNIDHWLWTSESSMEIRFMPSLARDINQVGFILNLNDEIGKSLRNNSVFKDTFNKDYAFEFVSEGAKEKFMNTGFVDDFFYRADYIIFGIPINYFEGILVGREVENDQKYLSRLKELFPRCYICNLDGKVIVE